LETFGGVFFFLESPIQSIPLKKLIINVRKDEREIEGLILKIRKLIQKAYKGSLWLYGTIKN